MEKIWKKGKRKKKTKKIRNIIMRGRGKGEAKKTHNIKKWRKRK